MRRPVRNVREWSSDPRSIGLLGVAAVYARVGVTYLPWAGDYRQNALPDILDTLTHGVYVVCVLWFLSSALVAYVGLGQVSVRPPIRWLLALTVAMPTAWGTIYAVSWFFTGRKTLELSTGVLYLAVALIVGSLIIIPPARLYSAHWRTVTHGPPPTSQE